MKRKEKPIANAPEASVAVPQDPTGGLLSKAPLDVSKFKRLSRPPFVVPLNLPVGGEIAAKIIDVVESVVGKRKGKDVVSKSLHLETDGGRHCLFPIATVMETALGEKPEIHKGKKIAIRVLEPRMSGNYKKRYFNCEVFLAD